MFTMKHSQKSPMPSYCRISLRRLAGILLLFIACLIAYEMIPSRLHRVIMMAVPAKLPTYRATGASCRALFNNDKAEHIRAQAYMRSYKGQSDTSFLNLSCQEFISARRYVTSTMSNEEAGFPIAYSIVVFKDFSQVERLFRAIYRPQNCYCFHIDTKSARSFRESVKRMANCFDNVFISSRSVDVKWGTYTVLEADLICMKDLLLFNKKWKYLINLTGQEFPLRTNLELVRILRAFNGSNAMEGTVKHINSNRVPAKRPYNVHWTKGSLHIVAKRAFFEFLFSSRKVMTIIKVLRPMPFIDETLFSTLNHNPQLGTPGAFLGEPETGSNYPFLPRLKNWGTLPCLSGKVVRAICIWGARDLPLINSHPELFVNKLYWNFQPLALDCLEERHWNHTRRDYGDLQATTDPKLNVTFYENLIFSKLHQ